MLRDARFASIELLALKQSLVVWRVAIVDTALIARARVLDRRATHVVCDRSMKEASIEYRD